MIKTRWLDDGAFEGVEVARATLADAHPDHAALLEYVPKLMKVDFSSLREPWYEYAEQTSIIVIASGCSLPVPCMTTSTLVWP